MGGVIVGGGVLVGGGVTAGGGVIVGGRRHQEHQRHHMAKTQLMTMQLLQGLRGRGLLQR